AMPPGYATVTSTVGHATSASVADRADGRSTGLMPVSVAPWYDPSIGTARREPPMKKREWSITPGLGWAVANSGMVRRRSRVETPAPGSRGSGRHELQARRRRQPRQQPVV